MKHKTNPSSFAKATEDRGPGLIVALGAPADNAGKMERPSPSGKSESRDLDSYDDVTTDTVPLDMLSMPDDQEQMQPPEVGDVVNYQVTGKVVAIGGSATGQVAKVQRQSINGQELPDAEPDETNSDNDNPENANQSGDGDEGQSLRGQAAGMGMLS